MIDKFKVEYRGRKYNDCVLKSNGVITVYNYLGNELQTGLGSAGKTKIQFFTGFKDKNDNEIFGGDNLTDKVELNGKIIDSKQKVFWNQPTGSWHLDNSYNQDETTSTELWLELHDFEYEILT